MPLIVFLRGVNVGGHRTFRPSLLAAKLSRFGMVNIGAAGTFVVWKSGPRADFVEALRRHLPHESHIAICTRSEFLGTLKEHPYGNTPPPTDVTRFVSIFASPGRLKPSLPIAFPSDEEWLVRLLAVRGRFVFGEYRRHMKTIGYLGQVDKVFGAIATTRNWKTLTAIAKILETPAAGVSPSR